MSEEKVSLSKNQPAPGDKGFVVPAASVPLPSMGLIYPSDSPLAGKEFVEIKAMTALEEDILTSQGLLKNGTVLDVLMKACLIDRSIDVSTMIAGDKNAILTAIRITGYGQEYVIEVECPCCGKKSNYEFDLAQIPVKRLGVLPKIPNTNEFYFQLPVSKAQITFKLLTGADEKDLSAMLSKLKKLGNEGLVTARLTYQLLSINGETDRSKISQLVRSIPARDSKELRKHIEKISPGVDMKQLFKCPFCTEESEVDVPMTTEFFWPSA
jgi:hypothetical protein